MRLLLDTHVLIWWAAGDRIASSDEIAEPSNDVFVSAVSVWEAEIKAAAGKLEVSIDLASGAREHGFAELPIDFAHAVEAGRLPGHHRDPYDRMLIAQARLEGLTLVTRDPAFAAYDVARLPA